MQELKEIKESLRDRSMMTDILKYQIKEIDAAKLSNPDEEEKLEKLRIKLKDIEKYGDCGPCAFTKREGRYSRIYA